MKSEETMQECISALLASFPGSFINEKDEFIAHRKSNQYLIVANCKTPFDVRCKVLEWFSRPAHKTSPCNSDRRNSRFHNFMLNGVNHFLGTNFSRKEMELIYTYLGNACNHKKLFSLCRVAMIWVFWRCNMDKGILFNIEMVQALLAGKSVTRRPIKPRYRADESGFVVMENWGTKERTVEKVNLDGETFDPPRYVIPPCKPGDVLYVRETWQYLYALDENEEIIEGTGKYYYAATDMIPFNTYIDPEGVKHEKTPWRPSIHMPKAAARIWLKVTDVRVERLQEIDEEQAWAEGIKEYTKDQKVKKYAVSLDWWEEYHRKHRKVFTQNWWQDMPRTAKEAYSHLWNSTIKKPDMEKHGWDENPWVWVIEFERCEKPREVNRNEKV